MSNIPLQHQLDGYIRNLHGTDLILLESQQADHPSSGVSYLAAGPEATIRGWGSRIEITEGGKTERLTCNPWDALREFRARYGGWLFGYLGYDLKNFSETLSSNNPRLLDAPDFWFMKPRTLLAAQNGRVTPLLGKLPDISEYDNHKEPEFDLSRVESLVSRDNYLQVISEIRACIAEGDFYELNYSYPLRGRFSGDTFELYRRMREINPVPFGGYIRTGDIRVCCASPERFLKKTGTRISSEPIKGTAARSDDLREDLRQKQRLLNEKNRAENLMIVDLVRHDMSRVALPGSVRVSKLFDIQTFGTVHQLISTVEADVPEQADPVEIIRACFPMGSMTGAPKISVMKKIEELEVYRRGIYSGAIGYFDPHGNFDFNVVIRSALIQNGELIYPVGGAITSDSDPDDEWEETKIKSRALLHVFSPQSP